MNECVFTYRTYHIVSQGGLQFYLSEIGLQLVKYRSKAPLSSSWMNVSLYLCFKTSLRVKPGANHMNGFAFRLVLTQTKSSEMAYWMNIENVAE